MRNISAGQPTSQPSVDHAVISLQGHHTGDTQKGGSAHVITCQGQAVLKGTDASACCIEFLGGLGALGRPIGNGQRYQNNDNKK